VQNKNFFFIPEQAGQIMKKADIVILKWSFFQSYLFFI